MKTFPAEIRDALGRYLSTVNPPDPPLVYGLNGYRPKPEPVTLLQRIAAEEVLYQTIVRAMERRDANRHQK